MATKKKKKKKKEKLSLHSDLGAALATNLTHSWTSKHTRLYGDDPVWQAR